MLRIRMLALERQTAVIAYTQTATPQVLNQQSQARLLAITSLCACVDI